jgi:hypothetical protein
MISNRVAIFAIGLCLAASVSSLHAASLVENFNDITTMPGQGWVQINNSVPLGNSFWFQGNPGVFTAQAGPANSYIGANFENAAPGGDISNWLITPELALDAATQLSFYTRTEVQTIFADRLEVRLSTAGASTDVGNTANSVGDFTTLLLTINPDLDPLGYPGEWTQFTIPLSMLGGPTSGRLAFRYFLPDTDEFADYIGIDTLAIVQVPEPSAVLLMAIGFICLAAFRRRVLAA